MGYPVIEGLPDEQFQTEVNYFIKDRITGFTGEGAGCDEWPKRVVRLTGDVVFAGNKLVSVNVDGWTCVLNKDGMCSGAHPTHVNFGLNFMRSIVMPDGMLRTSELSLHEIFKPGADYQGRLFNLFRAGDVPLPANGYRPPNMEPDFVVTPQGIELLNLYSGAGHAIHFKIPFAKISDILAPEFVRSVGLSVMPAK